MSERPLPWRDHAALAALARDWDRRFAGRTVDRVGGGPGWLRLSLMPDDAREDRGPPAQLFLTARPGAVLCWDDGRSPPPAVLDALDRIPQKRLTAAPYLLGAALARVAVPEDDRILALAFRRPDGSAVHLLHQHFGPRGNLVLLTDAGERLWSAHGSPHPALLDPPRRLATPPADPGDVAAVARAEAPVRLAARLAADLRQRLDADLRRTGESADRLIANLSRDLDAADDGELWRRRGETLAIHLHALRRGAEEVTLPDAAGEPLTIPLDPRLPPHAAVEACFKKARKAARGRDTIAARLAAARGRRAAVDAAAAELAAVDRADADGLAALLAWRDAHADLLPVRNRRGDRVPATAAAVPFRRYLLDGRWEVWVGRNDRENDELTHRASHPRDLWFHAQGIAGSHVILRTGGRPETVPKAVIARAAALAAWFSKARTSGLVPVLTTERRYVRKPRKAPPGQAATLRHDSLMVAPAPPPDPAPCSDLNDC